MIIGGILFVLRVVLFFSIAVKWNEKITYELYSIQEYAPDGGNVVYTPKPTQYPEEYYVDITSVNDNLYWIYQLDENKSVLEDIESGDWSLMTNFHYNVIKEFDYYDIFDEELKGKECYICVYVPFVNRIITNVLEIPPCEFIIVFLYDTESYKYYCYGVTVYDNDYYFTG